MTPKGATHKSPSGRYYRRVGKFWYVWNGDWWVMSGEPVNKDKLEEIE